MAAIDQIKGSGGKWYRKDLLLLDASGTTLGTVVRTAGPGYWDSVSMRRRPLLEVLRAEQYEVRDDADRCVRRVSGPTADPPTVRVSDAEDREVLRLEEAVAPWSRCAELCLFVADRIVGALPRQNNWHLVTTILDGDGQLALYFHHLRKKPITPAANLSHQVELIDSQSALHEPFASALILAALIKTREVHLGGL
jgi:hypothetical protein